MSLTKIPDLARHCWSSSTRRVVNKRLGLYWIFLFGIVGWTVAQPPTYQVNKSGQVSSETWKTFADVKFQLRDDFYHPQFGDKVKALNGKSIEIVGYIYPFEQTKWSKHFALSSLPLSACFFCGVGGPETVVEVEARTPIKQSDKPVRIRGTLVLNTTDTEKMIYIVKNAEYIGE